MTKPMQRLSPLPRWWRAAAIASAWLIDRGARAALALFALVLMLLAISALSTAVLGRSPWWLPGAHSLDPNLLNALGSILLGFAGLYIGNRLRKFQEVEAAARASLALNVDLRARVVSAGEYRILEVVVDVHNVSRATWFVPMAYLSIRSALNGGEAISLKGKFSNIAMGQYSAALCQLQPDEREQFLFTLAFTPEETVPVAVVVGVEVVGASGQCLGPRKAMMKFVEFMNENDGARHRYYCIGRCNIKESRWYGQRCFLVEDGSMDQEATENYLSLLADIRLFGREQVVALAEQGRLTGERAIKGASLPAGLVETGYGTDFGEEVT